MLNIKFDKEAAKKQDGTQTLESIFVGISKERFEEMQPLFKEVFEKYFNKEDEWSPGDILQACKDIPQTPEECYFLGFVIGKATADRAMMSNPLIALMSSLGH